MSSYEDRYLQTFMSLGNNVLFRRSRDCCPMRSGRPVGGQPGRVQRALPNVA